MDEEFYEEEFYRIKDWVPPWIDNGSRLKELVDFLTEYGDEDAWKIMSVLLVSQLNEDILRLKSLVEQMIQIEKDMESGY